ncbi:hypothetical protein [Cellulomonas telluris]|uniref:hypothetical protein n=1 Tax=Cellulomonas telluris TaxID=2306636 RepID=UPI0010A7EB5F|nr:hypothetical protein [Cellulomonas telluris]
MTGGRAADAGRSTPRALLGRVGRRLVRPAVAGAVAAVALLVFGIHLVPTLVVAVGVAGLAAVLERVDVLLEPVPDRPHPERRDGTRGEVLELAWTMVGRDGRAGERALRRLRAVAAGRLARHGVDLANPGSADDVDRLLGPRARATLTRTTYPLPSFGDVAHTVAALERLGPDARPPTPDPAEPVPAPAAAPLVPDPRPGRTDA